MPAHILMLVLLSLTSSLAHASDPRPLQDICVAYLKSPVFVNGHVCKDPKLARADDFFISGLDTQGYTLNKVGSNTVGISLVRLDFATPPLRRYKVGSNTVGISLVRIDFANHL